MCNIRCGNMLVLLTVEHNYLVVDVCYLLHKYHYMFRRLWPSSGWMNWQKHRQIYLASVLYTVEGRGIIGWRYEISCLLSGGGGGYMDICGRPQKLWATDTKCTSRTHKKNATTHSDRNTQRKEVVNMQHITTTIKIVHTTMPASTPYFDKPTITNPAKNIIDAPINTMVHPNPANCSNLQ